MKSKMVYFARLLLFAVLCFALNANAQLCQQNFTEVEHVNLNATISPYEYNLPHFRNFVLYARYLGKVFFNYFMNTLSPGAVWIDVGGGFGIAALQASTHLRTIVINAQDFWQTMHSDNTPHHIIRNAAVALQVSFADIPREKHRYSDKKYINDGNETRDTAGAFFYSWVNVKDHHYQILKKRILKKLHDHSASNHYQYLVGMAEKIFPNLTIKAELITDLYGAFFYSSARIELLEMYYNQLKDNGQAFVRFRTSQQIGVEDQIDINGQKIPLIQFLTKTYPQIFRIDPMEPFTLIIKRLPGRKNLNLTATLKATPPTLTNYDGMEIPFVEWTLIK